MSRDQYSYWRSLLKRLPVQIPQQPQAGFWRRRMGRGGAWRPVAIWVEANALKCLDGDRLVEPWTVWVQVCTNATTEADYRARVAGTPYRDEFFVSGNTSETTTDAARAAPIGPSPRRLHGNQTNHSEG